MMVKLNEGLHVKLNCITSAVKVPHESVISTETYFGLIQSLDTCDRRKIDELYTPTRDGTGLRRCADIKKLQEVLPQMYRVTYMEGNGLRTVFATEDYCKKFLDMQPTDVSAKDDE